MLTLIKPHQYSTYMRYARATPESWSKLIEHPMVIADKDAAPLVIWGHMRDKVEVDPVSRQPRCIADNVGRLYALQVDVDNGCTIDEFDRDFHRYSYQLYTSFSYGFKEGDRFRAVFPLKEPIETSWLVPPVKTYLINLFRMCDESCFDQAHWQILPCVRAKDAPYRYLQHSGERLSFANEDFGRIAAEYYDDSHWKREIAEADRDPFAKHDGALTYAQKVFDSTNVGERNRTAFKMLMWLKDTVGCSYGEVISLRPPVGFDEEYFRMAERIYS